MAIGSMMPLIGRYLAQEGFTGAQIGTVTAAGTLVAIFASAFWGGVFDRCQNGRKVVRTLCICAAAIALGLSTVHIYGIFLIIYRRTPYYIAGRAMYYQARRCLLAKSRCQKAKSRCQ